MLGLQGQDLARSHRWITRIRLLVYTFLPVISLGFLWKFQPPMRLLPLIGLIALALLINLGQLVSWKRGKPLFKESLVTWTLDIFMITGIVHYTGGPVSDFGFLYILVIIAGGYSRGARGSFVAAGVSVLIYGSMIYLSYQGLLSQMLPDPITMRADWGPTVALKVFLNATFFILIAAIIGYITERLKRKSGELEVKTSEFDQLKLDTDTIMETIPAGILAFDFAGNILYFNRAGQQILGTTEQRIHNTPSIHVFLAAQPGFYDAIENMINNELPARSLEIDMPVSNGNIRPIGIKATYLQDKQGGNRGIVVYFTDLTEAKDIEREMRISDRLSAVGELAGDLAHEIRNPLAVIRGSVEFMARELNPGGQMERLMTGILRESDRLNTLVYEFMDFARLSPPSCASLPVKSVMGILQKIPEITESVEKIHDTTSKTTCWADRDQLLRVIDSLIRDVGRQWDPRGNAELFVAEPGRECEVWKGYYATISKDQVGFVIRFPGKVLPESEVDDLFRPFRHADEKHRGLALCTAHRIVESHQGEIKVINLTGQGLALIVLLPISPDGNSNLSVPIRHTQVQEGAVA
ncbi:hypothetical protein AMJ86_01790 [bacterium SM23_57]|nr:MAG: hypothetical protein AMJ86_01790 [bacterium SM23_57]